MAKMSRIFRAALEIAAQADGLIPVRHTKPAWEPTLDRAASTANRIKRPVSTRCNGYPVTVYPMGTRPERDWK